VELVDDAPQVTDTPFPAGTPSKRQREEELPENNAEEADERSPKRSKIGEAEVQPEAASGNLALAAMQFPKCCEVPQGRSGELQRLQSS